MKNKYRVLLVEDQNNYSKLIERTLSRHENEIDFELLVVRNFSEAINIIGKKSIDIILLDLPEPVAEDMDVVGDFNKINPEIPIIVLTGMDDEKFAIEAIHKGAADYIIKKDFPRSSLARVIKYSVEREYAYEKLRKNQEQVCNNFAGKNVAAYKCRFDRFWTMLIISDNIAEITGYPAQAFIDNNEMEFSSIIHPDDCIRVSEQIATQIAQNGIFEVEYRIIDNSGNVKWLLDSGNCQRQDNQRVKNLYGVLVDISRYKNNENHERETDLQQHSSEISALSDSISEDVDDVLKLVKQTNLTLLENNKNIVESEKLKNNLFLVDSLLNKVSSLLGNYTTKDAQLTADREQLNYERFCLAKKIRTVIDTMIPRAAVKGLNLFASIPDINMMVEGDQALMVQMLDNLICTFVNFSSARGANIYIYVNQIDDDIRVDIQMKRSQVDSDKIYQLMNLNFLDHNFDGQFESCHEFEFVKNVVGIHNGKIWVDTDESENCGISLQLPIEADRRNIKFTANEDTI